MRAIITVLVLIALSACAAGCGETISGVGKDCGRMGKGVNTFFFRQ